MMNEKEKKEYDKWEKWVNSFDWTFAKTYAKKAPHEYLVRDKISKDNQKLMLGFAKFIKEHGYEEKFWQTTFVYLNIGKYKYWTCEYPLYKTSLVNRCLVENKYGYNN